MMQRQNYNNNKYDFKRPMQQMLDITHCSGEVHTTHQINAPLFPLMLLYASP